MKKSMRSFIALTTALFLFFSWFGPGITMAAEAAASTQSTAQRTVFSDAYDPETILVKFRPGTAADTIRSLNAQLKLEEKGVISQIDVRLMKVPRGRTAADMVAVLSRNPNIEFVDHDYTMQTALTPNDPLFSSGQLGLKAIGAEAAWDLSVGSGSVLIAVLDTGINASHEDLAGRVVSGYNFISDNANTQDDHGHGTMVAGVLGALSDNGRGIAGVTWENPILPVKVMGADGSGSHSAIAQGIVYAADQGASVINLSLGGNSSSSTLKSAVDYAANRGVVMVAAAGNSNSSVMYPAAYENVIAVAALDQHNEKASYSNYGAEISVTAPGTVASTSASGRYANGSGTSFAAPFVAGLAGLILSESPGLSPQQVQQIMEEQADDLGTPGWDPYHGWGRINLYQSLASLAEAPPVIQLLGEPIVHVPLGDVYHDAGATASDPGEGDITSRIVTINPVDVETPGSYSITYNVSNSQGIASEEVTRLVIVEEIVLPPVGSGGGMPASVRDQLPPRAQQALDNRGNSSDAPGSRPSPSDAAPGRSTPSASSSGITSDNRSSAASGSSQSSTSSSARPAPSGGGNANAPSNSGRRP